MNVEMLNKTTKNLDTVLKAARTIEASCKDHSINTKDLRVGDDLRLKLGSRKVLPMSQLAQGQLCGKCHVPGKYIIRMQEAGLSDLAAENLNRWLQVEDKELFVREYDGNVRGIMSDRYSVFDSPEVITAVKQTFGDRFALVGHLLNEERLHLRLIEKEKMPIDGEDLFAGLTVDSSDVGRSSLKVKFFVWKQVCSNGLIIPATKVELFTQKHVGITSEEFAKSLGAGLEKVETLKEKIGEWIEEAAKISTETDMEELVKEIKDKTALSDDDANEVITVMIADYSPTKWGLINGITKVAQKFEFERQAELEEIAGNWLLTV